MHFTYDNDFKYGYNHDSVNIFQNNRFFYEFYCLISMHHIIL